MATVIAKYKLMPEDTDVDLAAIAESAKKIVEDWGGHFEKSEEVPLAFGLKAIKIQFNYDNKQRDSEQIEEKLATIQGVSSIELENLSLAMG